MKPKPTLRYFLSIAGSTLLATSAAQAQLYWDQNAATAGAGATPTGTWGTSNFWNTDSTGANLGAFQVGTLNTDDLFFVAAPGAASGNNAYVVTTSLAQVANSLTFQASGATTLSGGTSITLGNGTPGAGGITMNQFAFGSTAQGAATISTAVILNNTQTWTNNAAAGLAVKGGINNAGNTLTIAGTGNFDLGDNTANIITGAGGFTMNGTGKLTLSASGTTPAHNFSGALTINAGTVGFQSAGSLGTGNIEINGGVLAGRFASSVTRNLGSAAGEIRITGGVSGWSGEGTSGSTLTITGVGSNPLVWGSTHFAPAEFVLQGVAANTTGIGAFANNINLDGADRTIRSDQTGGTAGSGTFSGVISNSSGTAGLIKTGIGHHILSNTNTYNGSTTISQGTLTANSTAALGNSSATNTLIFNGGTLRAGGAITSVALRGVTLTSTGIIDNNGQAISIAGNITGAGGLTKNSTGTLTLSGTNDYAGITVVNAGTLAITRQLSLYNNTPAGWTAANVNVKSGATLALNVDSAGTAGFDTTSLNTLLGNILVANTAAQGMQGGTALGIDTSTANLGTFTQGDAITNSTGAFGGNIGLTKLGTGTLVLDKANTYKGVTIISAGTLQLNAGGVIATPILNNATFTVNSAGAVTQGTDFGLIGGTGTLTKTLGGTLTLNLANTYTGDTLVSAGTIALGNALALQNSAYNTASANGGLDVTGYTTPTLGGLTGSVNLSATLITGYDAISNLTLNPQTGITKTYSGDLGIGNGSMSLTKTGAGTQILTGTNSYTGATIVRAGTLTIGAGGSLSASSALQMGGGIFSYGNTAAGQTVGGLAVGGGNSTVSNTASGQTLTLGAINRTASIFGTVSFATLTGPISTTTGNANGIIGPWATTGSGTSLRYVVGSPDGVTPTNISAFTTGTTATANTWANLTDATVNYEYSGAVAAMGAGESLTGNTLRYSGAATITAINATSTLTLNGLMQAGSGILTISGGPTTGGILIGSTGELVIAANTAGTTISAAIGGTGRLVYSGAGGRLLLSSTTSNYSGGTVINSGQLAIASDAALGNPSGSITLNGGAILGNSTNPQAGNAGGVNITSARDVIVGAAGGSIGAHGNNTFATTGKLTGSGPLTMLAVGGAGGQGLSFNSTSNDFTGAIFVPTNAPTISFNSLADSANPIVFNGAQGGNFIWGSGATTALVLNSRSFQFSPTVTGLTLTIANNNTASSNANTVTVNTDLLMTGTGSAIFTLGGTNAGTNVFAGRIPNGSGGTTAVTKTGIGTWALSGSNTYTGATTVSAGTLAGTNAVQSFGTSLSGISIQGSGTLSLRNDSSVSFTNGTSAYNIANSASGATINVDRVTGTGSNTITVGNLTTTSTAASWGLNFTGAKGVSLSAGTLNTPVSTAGSQVHTITNNIAGGGTLTLASVFNQATTVASPDLVFAGTGTTIVTGAITQTLATMELKKSGAGTVTLEGSNTYTGPTAINGGTLVITGATQSTSAITFSGGGILGLKTSASVAATSTSVDFTGQSVLVTGPTGAPSYTLLTAVITGTEPTLAVPVPGYELDVVGNELRLVQTGGDPYTTWSGAADFETDTNNDGVNNGLAWLLGAPDKNTSAIGLLPTLDNTSDPDYFIFTYRRKDDASTDPNTTITAEYSTTLGSWTTAVDNADIDIIVTDNHYSVTPGVDRVEVKLKRSTLAPGGKLFARLKSVHTP